MLTFAINTQLTRTTAKPERLVEAEAKADTLYCKNHINTETLLRCNRCSEPMCIKCSVQTAVGYRCKECIRGAQNNYFNVQSFDYPVAFFTSLIVTAIASPIISLIFESLGFYFVFFITIMLGSAAGGVLSQIVRKAVNKRRGRYLAHFSIAGIVVGILVGAVIGIFFFINVLNAYTIIFAIIAGLAARKFLR